MDSLAQPPGFILSGGCSSRTPRSPVRGPESPARLAPQAVTCAPGLQGVAPQAAVRHLTPSVTKSIHGVAPSMTWPSPGLEGSLVLGPGGGGAQSQAPGRAEWKARSALGGAKAPPQRVQNVSGCRKILVPSPAALGGGGSLLTHKEASACALTVADTCPPTFPVYV